MASPIFCAFCDSSLIVLLIAPDGVAGLLYRLREMFFTTVWHRRHRDDGGAPWC